MAMKPERRRYAKLPNDSVLFRGKQYWYYRDYFLRSPELKVDVAKLKRDGYKTRLIGPALSWGIVNLYTNPRKTSGIRRNFSRFGDSRY